MQKSFGKYQRQIIKSGVGYDLPQEAPQVVAQAVIVVDGFLRSVTSFSMIEVLDRA